MSLFQKSVLQKYLKSIEGEKVDKAWERFAAYFQNPAIQENIREAKEEQYQEGFLRELFVKVLGYTLNPQPDYNLTTEYKNVKDSKKADGAILQDGKPIAVIELKGTNITNLDKIEVQAFGYKNNQPGAVYVITSNFEKLRFYIDNAVDYEEFNLFQLTKERFAVLWLCIARESVLKGLPKQTKDNSLLEEENITKKLYKDYSAFRKELHESIAKKNPEQDRILLFKKTQKLLDRFLFIFFAEDRLLLPPNSISKIIEQWVQLRDELDAYTPLYARFKKYFDYLNTGYQGKEYEIFAYNGGLFEPDAILDNITIDDTLLYKHTLQLSHYDFQTEVDVNILGHIFEHSLNELEEMTAQVEGQEIDKSKTKRKKDGVFYTPKYITKYIVENTVGRLCEEKRAEFDVAEEAYTSDKKKSKKVKKELLDKLEAYREWLLQITICDPACGSGAFLNQALEFLIQEHGNLDELQTKLLGGSIVFPDVENSILENNLYGVDINEESVDIAKLSLWLRTAQKGRKLTSLNNNIKCGNSLIDDVEVAGEKAFVWEKEFPRVFAKGGFDVVVGNPPYVRAELLGMFRDFLENRYAVYNPSGDLFSYFYEKSFNLLKPKEGIFGFISNTFDKTTAGITLRQYLSSEIAFLKYIDFTEVQIFEGATTYPVIITAQNKKEPKNEFQYIKIPKASQALTIDINFHKSIQVEQISLDKENWSFKNKSAVSLIEKLNKNKPIREQYGKCYYGVKTALNEAFIIPKSYEVNEHVKPIFEGKELTKWVSSESVQQLILFESKWTKNNYGNDITEEEALLKLNTHFPKLMEHILPLKERAKKRYDKGDFFWELRNCVYYDLFENPKIVFPNLQNKNKFSFDETGSYINAPAVILPTNDKFIIAVLNSKLVWYFLTNICVVRSGGYIEVKPQYFEQIPIPIFSKTLKSNLTIATEKAILNTSKIQKIIANFEKSVVRKFQLDKLSKKLQSWHLLTFAEFVKELQKQKIKMTLSEEAEWEEYFEQEKAKALAIQAEIDKTDKEIDRMVYELYDLTPEEIAIVENS